MEVILPPQKRRALEVLGNKCSWCDDDIQILLEVDHILNDGKAHRAEAGYSSIEKWIVDNPEIANKKVQLLCANCHRIKSFFPMHWKEWKRIARARNKAYGNFHV